MATVTSWTPFGVALNVTANPGAVTRISATQFRVTISVSWSTYWSGASTNYGMTASSGGGSANLNSFGNYASSGSGTITGTYSISGNGGASKYITVTFTNIGPDTSASTSVGFYVSVPALPSYAVSYNANGGTGAPGKQTKWKDQTLKLSTTKPTRTGYIFQGWATSSTSSTVNYQPGANYTSNAAITLYAVWKAETYTVSYDANSGTGAPADQLKHYGIALRLSSTVPTKTNYNFLGWTITPESTTVNYSPGDEYTDNKPITLYAVWELAYTPPRINDISVDRCYSNGTLADDGRYARVVFNWETDKTANNIVIAYDGKEVVISLSGTKGSVDRVIGEGLLDTENYYDISIKITDTHGSTSVSRTVEPMHFTIDIKNGGDGIAFGKPASRPGFDVSMDSFFNKKAIFDNEVEINTGKVIIHNANILSNTDLNTIKSPGNYACNDSAVPTLLNCPTTNPFQLEVGYSYGGTVYIYHKLTEGASGRTYYRQCNVGTNGWTEWKKYITEDMLGDYIVEVGVSGRWLYKKYNSGYVELYGRVIGTPHNGVFINIEFPEFMLYEYNWSPRIIPGSSYTSAMGLPQVTSQTLNYNGHYAAHYYVRSATGDLRDVSTQFDVFAIGRWKPL